MRLSPCKVQFGIVLTVFLLMREVEPGPDGLCGIGLLFFVTKTIDDPKEKENSEMGFLPPFL
jgi:hypothetical protein